MRENKFTITQVVSNCRNGQYLDPDAEDLASGYRDLSKKIDDLKRTFPAEVTVRQGEIVLERIGKQILLAQVITVTEGYEHLPQWTTEFIFVGDNSNRVSDAGNRRAHKVNRFWAQLIEEGVQPDSIKVERSQFNDGKGTVYFLAVVSYHSEDEIPPPS